MIIPEHLQYTGEHEWVDLNGAVARIGITQIASTALGDIVFVDLPQVGSSVQAGAVCGEVESTKSVSDVYSPVGGEVVEVNPDVLSDPGLVNSDPYGTGWLFVVRADDVPALLDATAYSTLVKE